ncbi:uncharacterized protein [Fopius arisanus]|uniref:Uncharacterized protein n=1 Tax=Fopius arisanus TaxID=64838 RepID=A0A9R1TAK4_9HYME|nr:PREDICTED: uncharacterized protein LOC105268213 [Fopius arisanus]
MESDLPLEIQPLEVEVETEKVKYNFSNSLKYRWKGKVVSEKFYNRKMKQAAARITRRAAKEAEASSDNSNEQHEPDNVQEVEFPVKGDRIVDLEFMAKRMICIECQGHLLLDNIRKEIKRRCRSILHIECEECKIINKVPTKGNCNVNI